MLRVGAHMTDGSVVRPLDILRVAPIGSMCEEPGCDMPAWFVIEEQHTDGSGRFKETLLCAPCRRGDPGSAWHENQRKAEGKEKKT